MPHETTKKIASSALDFIRGIKKPVLKAELLLGAKERITGEDIIRVGAEPGLTQRQAISLFLKFTLQEEQKKIGIKPITEIPPELGREAGAEAGLGVFGVTGIVPQKIISKFLTKVNTERIRRARTPIGTSLTNLYRQTIDRFNPIVRLVRQAERGIKERGISEIPIGKNPEILARRYLGIKGISESKLSWKTFRIRDDGNLEVTGKSLSEELTPVKNNLDDLRALLVAEREVELFKRGVTKGIKEGEAEQVVAALKEKLGNDGFVKLSQVAQGTRSYAQRAILDPLREVGAISNDVYTAILKSNQFYTPFARVVDDVVSKGSVKSTKALFETKVSPLKRIRGAELDIIDPLETLISNTYRVTDFVEKARVTRAIVGLRTLSPDLKQIIKPVPPKFVPVAVQKIKKVPGKEVEFPETIFRPSFFNPAPDTIAVLVNGARKFFKVPQDVATLIREMSPGEMNILVRMARGPAKLLRAGATLSPEFIGRNPLRDQMTAMVQAKYGYIPGIDLVKGIWELIGRKDVYGRWLATGSAQSMFVSLDRLSTQKSLQELLLRTPFQRTKRGIIRTVKNPIEALRILSETAEAGTRIGVFRKATRKKAVDLEAGFESRDTTIDFARIGANMRAMNQVTAFINARIQGIDKIVRAFAKRPGRTTLFAVGGITVPSIMLYLHNRNDPRWNEIPRWQKDLFWIVFTENIIIRIPKPFELGMIFGTIPERILEWIDKNDPDALQSLGTTLFDQFGLGGVLPTFLVPIIENSTNFDFFTERPVVGRSVAGLPPEMQSNRFTSETAKAIGELAKVSPAKIDNMFLGYTGGLGRYALSISDSLLKAVGIADPPPMPEEQLADIPFIRAFIVRDPIGTQSESVNQFYDLLEQAESFEQASKRMLRVGEADEAVGILQDHPEVHLLKGLRNTSRKMAQLRQIKDIIFNSRDLTPEKKQQQLAALDELITELAQQALSFSEPILQR